MATKKNTPKPRPAKATGAAGSLAGRDKTKGSLYLDVKKMWALMLIIMIASVGTFSIVRSHAATCTQAYFKQGSRGSCVSDIQFFVNISLNPSAYATQPTINVDGVFGPLTNNAVRQVQSHKGLNADGIVGPDTWRVLCQDAAYSTHSSATHDVVTYMNEAGCYNIL